MCTALNDHFAVVSFCWTWRDFISLFSDLGVQGQKTTHLALQGGALTQYRRKFVLTCIFRPPVVLSEGFLKKKRNNNWNF